MNSIKFRLSLLNFLEFAVWGSYLTSLGRYLYNVDLDSSIGIFYAVQGIVAIFMPAIIGIIADRYIQAQKVLSGCHLIAGLAMGGASIYALTASTVSFGPLFCLYTISVAFFMPTIGLANSVAYSALDKAGLDTVKHFPPIRVFGTIGFICAMLFVNFTNFQLNAWQLMTSAVFSFIMCGYSLTMPACPISKNHKSKSWTETFGLNAFKLFKDRQMAFFFLFSMLLGVSLQITNGFANPFIGSFGDMPQYHGTFWTDNANLLISLSQMSETLCILLIPFFLKRFGIKVVMLMAMMAWVFRFGLFGIGDPGSGIVFMIASMIVYGIAFDFFNVSGSLYVDQRTDISIRSSAQGLFMLMTNGIGATVGTLGAQAIINDVVPTFKLAEGELLNPEQAMQVAEGWHNVWFIFAAYALVVAILFFFLFKNPKSRPEISKAAAADMGLESEMIENTPFNKRVDEINEERNNKR